MNDIHQLAQRFLDGLTTTEEERRLHELLRQDDAPDELRALLPMLEKPNLGHYADLWLTEDETETYRDIVRQRKLRKALRWATAAAAMAVVAIMLTGKPGNGHEKVFTHTDTVGMQLMKPTQPMALTKPNATAADAAIHHADPRAPGRKVPDNTPESRRQQPTARPKAHRMQTAWTTISPGLRRNSTAWEIRSIRPKWRR